MVEDFRLRTIPHPGTQAFTALVGFCVEHRSAVYAALPHEAAEIADAAGFPALFRLVHEFGGTMVAMSRGPGNRRRGIHGILSPDEVVRLHDRYGGLKVVLPSANGVFSSIRRVVIAEMLRRSLPVNRIAKQLGLSDRYIRATKTARGLT